MPGDATAATLTAELDALHNHLRELLAGREDDPGLAERPPNGTWSILESLRHLLWAERIHQGRFVPREHLARLGFTAEADRENRSARMLATEPPGGLPVFFELWHRLHDQTREHTTEGTAPVLKELDRNHRHLRAHIRIIERRLRATADNN